MRVLYGGNGWKAVLEELRARLPAGAQLAVWDRAAPLATQVADVEVLLPSNARVDAAVIAAAGKLRLIQQPAAGSEGIDLAAARARGIPVCNAPGANHASVAEAALLLLLALARRLPEVPGAMARAEIGAPVGVELGGKLLGIVGMGRTGRALAERALALGLRVRPLERGATAAQRLAFFAACDAVSLHCPLTAETRGLVDAAALAAMKPTALLVNLARGAIIDRGALETALAGGLLGGVGLDVYWEEPWDPADPLLGHPKVLTLPHIGGSTTEALGRIAEIVADNVGRLQRGEALRHRIA